MADIPASTWSETDASNNSASPEGAPEGMAPSGLNNTMRMMMGAIKRWFDWTIPKTTAGTTTAYTLSYSVAPAALVDGMSHLVQFNATCGSSPTLNVNSLGAKPLHKYSGGSWGVCAAGDLTANMVARVSYNSGDGTYRITSASFQIGAALLAVANTFSAILTMSGAAINEAKGADIASATTTDIGAATGNYVKVTGTTTITGLGTIQAGTNRTVEFSGALTLTHNATSLILPGGANILTAAGDTAVFRSLGSGNWKCIDYTRAAVVPHTRISFLATKNGADQTLTDETWAKLTFGTEVFDNGSYFDTSTSRYTPPAGTYLVTGRWGTSAFGPANVGSIAIYVNGTRTYTNTFTDGNGLRAFTTSISQVLTLNGTDYIELWGYVNTAGASQDVDGDAEFTTFAATKLYP